MKKFTTLIAVFFAAILTAQTTAIPDPNFEQALINIGIDSDATVNGQVLTSDIQDVVELDLSYTMSIDDLTGLQDFASLEILDIHFLNLTEIDLSGNPNLKEFYASLNELTNLDLSQNTQLEVLYVPHNLLTEIDVSNNPLLTEIYVGNEADDVGPHNNVEYVDLSNNPLVSIISVLNSGTSSINIANGNNNPDMWIDASYDAGSSPLVCLNVDDNEAATNNQEPYASWDLIGYFIFTNECNLSADSFSAENFSFYPNPVQDICYIQTKEPMAYELFTVSGAIIESGAIEVGENELRLNELAEGIYFLKLKNDEGATKTIKVLKE